MPEVSLLPKEYAIPIAPTPRGLRIFAVFSYLFLVVVLSIWGGLYFYKLQISDQINKVNEEIEGIKSTSLKGRDEEIKKIKEASEKLGEFKKVLDGHIYTSNIFNQLEVITLKTVYFNKFDLDIKKQTLMLGGVTDSYESFAKQFSELKTGKDIVGDVTIDSVSLTKEGVEFSFKITLSDNALLKK